MLELGFSIAAFFTSTLAAIFGLGGGMLLIALMPGFIPASAIIPVHATVQLASNVSRAAFTWRSIRWEYCTAFVAGSVAGSLLAVQFIQLINLEYITLFIGIFILLNVWLPRAFSWLNRIKGEFFTIGAFQTGLGLIGGATGPLGQASLARREFNKDEIVTTTAVFMSFTHLIKIFAYAWLGVSLAPWWKLILGMLVGVILGSMVGTKIRVQTNQQLFSNVLNILLSLLAVRMIFLALTNAT